MVHEDIFGGLKSALVRGYTLKEAMISFYNAGYKKDDIEDAARKLQYQITESKELRDLITQKNKSALAGNTYVPGQQQAQQASHPQTVSRVEVPANAQSIAKTGQQIMKRPVSEKEIPSKPASSIETPASSKEHESEVKEAKKESSGIGLSLQRAKAFSPKVAIKQKPKISHYYEGRSIQVVTIILVVLLLLLLSLLAGVFIFKNQIIQFFNNLLLK